MAIDNFRELTVYKKAFALAMQIFQISKKFPVEEKYALTSQIRRSSRSVCSSIGEGYRKRQYHIQIKEIKNDFCLIVLYAYC